MAEPASALQTTRNECRLHDASPYFAIISKTPEERRLIEVNRPMRSQNMGDKFDWWTVALCFLALQLPSIRAFAKYFPWPEFSVPAFLVFSLLGTWLVMRPPQWLVKALDRSWP